MKQLRKSQVKPTNAIGLKADGAKQNVTASIPSVAVVYCTDGPARGLHTSQLPLLKQTMQPLPNQTP